MPLGRAVYFGAWWTGEFRGAVIYARGNNRHLGNPYGLSERQVAELCRVALTDHPEFTVTEVVARTIRTLKQTNPGLRLLVSFADPTQGHDGAIYRAGNWLFLGLTAPIRQYLYQGRWLHQRDVTGSAQFHSRVTGHNPSTNWGGKGARLDVASLPCRTLPPKYRYAYPLDRAMRRALAPLAVPFPRGQGLDGEPSPSQGEGMGSTPIDRSDP